MKTSPPQLQTPQQKKLRQKKLRQMKQWKRKKKHKNQTPVYNLFDIGVLFCYTLNKLWKTHYGLNVERTIKKRKART